MSDYYDSPEFAAYMNAMADQLGAANRTRKAKLFEEYLEGPAEDAEPVEPLRVWEEHGVWCAVLRGPVGMLCGYARCPDGHPWIGLHADDEIPNPPGFDLEQPGEQALDDHGSIPMFAAMLTEGGIDEYSRTLAANVPVHGGLTWTGPMPVKGAPHGWWIGFDCGHAGDAMAPEMLERMPWASPAFRQLQSEGHVWSEEEVAMECKRMVVPILAALGVRADA